ATRRTADAALQARDCRDRAGRQEGRPSSSPLFDRYDFGPVVDGTVLPGHPYDPAATAVSADVPVLVGGVKDEMAIYLAPEDKSWTRPLTEAELRSRVARVAGGNPDRLMETYRRLFPGATPSDRLITILIRLQPPAALHYACGTKGSARARAGVALFVRLG